MASSHSGTGRARPDRKNLFAPDLSTLVTAEKPTTLNISNSVKRAPLVPGQNTYPPARPPQQGPRERGLEFRNQTLLDYEAITSAAIGRRAPDEVMGGCASRRLLTSSPLETSEKAPLLEKTGEAGFDLSAGENDGVNLNVSCAAPGEAGAGSKNRNGLNNPDNDVTLGDGGFLDVDYDDAFDDTESEVITKSSTMINKKGKGKGKGKARLQPEWETEDEDEHPTRKKARVTARKHGKGNSNGKGKGKRKARRNKIKCVDSDGNTSSSDSAVPRIIVRDKDGNRVAKRKYPALRHGELPGMDVIAHRAKNPQVDDGRDLPKCLADCDAADTMLWEWKESGLKSWDAIRYKWSELTGEPLLKTDLPVRYWTMKHYWIMTEGRLDDKALVRAVEAADVKLEPLRWRMVQEEYIEFTGVNTKPAFLRKGWYKLQGKEEPGELPSGPVSDDTSSYDSEDDFDEDELHTGDEI